MTLQAFKFELEKSYNQLQRIGLILFLLFGSICTLTLIFVSEYDRSIIIFLCLFGLFAPLGFFMFLTSIRNKKKVRNGEHEILEAINTGNDFVVWFFQHTLITKNELITKKNKSHSLQIYTKGGKPIRFMIKSEERLHEMIAFLSGHFPNALIGYTEENRLEASEIIGQKIKRMSI